MSTPARILIADDNPQGIELLEAYLAGSDYDLQTSTDGDDTLKKVKSFKPDLILLDVMMPKISGFEVCKRIKSDPETADIMVLMVTALDQPSDIDRAVDAKTDDFLTKPIPITQSHCSRSSPRRAARHCSIPKHTSRARSRVWAENVISTRSSLSRSWTCNSLGPASTTVTSSS
jgi:CheY-like chemotaxis protein